MRTIKQIIPAEKVNMGGHLLDQPLPVNGVEQIDPFLLIHHWHNIAEKGLRQQEVGVAPHPHRGFSPVTFVYQGSVHHRDSLGNDAVVGPGGTQWMHAGRGVVHSERPGKDFLEVGGPNEFIQFWVNTPAKYKMETPYYLPIWMEDTPTIERDGAKIGVVAGTFEDKIGPAKTYSPQTLLRVETTNETEMSLEIEPSFNALIYVLDGKVDVAGQKAFTKDLIWFNNDSPSIQLSIGLNTRFILLSGEPIGEKVSQYGPFVMNTQTEVMQALRDAQMGKMGVLIEEFD